ncbi:hypothetical protein B0H10DRAFT_1947436 [Mycena sp. CBHHK59/15]|nr:hypothetical protein B0H10DRAFT_1947436 [Mycena sp. CBHHK59/15]
MAVRHAQIHAQRQLDLAGAPEKGDVGPARPRNVGHRPDKLVTGLTRQLNFRVMPAMPSGHPEKRNTAVVRYCNWSNRETERCETPRRACPEPPSSKMKEWISRVKVLSS